MSINLSGVGLTHANGHIALQDINLQVGKGERIAIIGPSGAGKTTLLRLLATSLTPSAGQLSLLEQHPWRLSSRKRQQLRSRIGLIHQTPPLPPRQRVVTAVLAGKLGQWSLLKSLISLLHPLDIKGAQAALARLDLADKLFDRCAQLSGGQLQRVGIARALYQSPELMLADEPVSAMDPILAEHTLSVLNEEASRQNTTLLASLHAVELALNHFPRIIGIRQGQLMFDLPAEAVSREQLNALYANEQLGNTQAPAALAPLDVQIARC